MNLYAQARPRHHQFTNTTAGFAQRQAWLRDHTTVPVHAGLEATSRYGDALALFLYHHGIRVSVLNPARTHAFAKSELSRTKTDKADAALIARFVVAHQPPAWTPPPPEQQQLQQRLRAHLRAHPTLQQRCALLQSIPDIGECTALKLLAELPPCRSARQAAAHAGLSPRQRDSGSSVRGKAHLSKTGNARLRKALYLPAVVAMRCNPILREFAQRLGGRGKPKMAVVGAVMRKLLHQAHGVLKHGQPFDPNYAPPA